MHTFSTKKHHYIPYLPKNSPRFDNNLAKHYPAENRSLTRYTESFWAAITKTETSNLCPAVLVCSAMLICAFRFHV